MVVKSKLFEGMLSNNRDEYNRLQRQHDRDNARYLSDGDFDDAMENDERFLRGFYHWSSDSHNWGCQIADNFYIVISYATDGGTLKVSLVRVAGRNREVVDWKSTYSKDYSKVMELAAQVAAGYDDYGMFE